MTTTATNQVILKLLSFNETRITAQISIGRVVTTIPVKVLMFKCMCLYGYACGWTKVCECICKHFLRILSKASFVSSAPIAQISCHLRKKAMQKYNNNSSNKNNYNKQRKKENENKLKSKTKKTTKSEIKYNSCCFAIIPSTVGMQWQARPGG